MDERTAQAVEAAHRELWKRFIHGDGIILDYADRNGAITIPSPEECRDGKPNALGWGTPIENGPFFNGLYLPAVCKRWRLTARDKDKAEARKVAAGLLFVSEVSGVPGFIARGVATDGRSHYPLGSDDQTHPWFYGLYEYVKSGIPDASERAAVIGKMREVAEVLEATHWRCPCDGAFTGQFRGEYAGAEFRGAARLLFILRAMYEITKDGRWLAAYRSALGEKPDGCAKTRLEICAEGYVFDLPRIPFLRNALWIVAGAQAALKELAAVETDKAVRACYRKGLIRNAEESVVAISKYSGFDINDDSPFRLHHWRDLNRCWKPQALVNEAVAVAEDVLRRADQPDRERGVRPRGGMEQRHMTEPLCAAFMVALAGDAGLIARALKDIERALCHYDWSKINLARFFFAECAYYELVSSHAIGVEMTR